MFNDISCDKKDNKDECLKCRICEGTCEKIWCWAVVFHWTRFCKEVVFFRKQSQGAWDNFAEKMLLEFAKSVHPIFRSTIPLSRGQLKSKGKGKVSTHFSAHQDTIDTIYRIILSVNQLSVYGAVAAICEEFEDHQDRTV